MTLGATATLPQMTSRGSGGSGLTTSAPPPHTRDGRQYHLPVTTRELLPSRFVPPINATRAARLGRLSFCPHGLGCAGFFVPCPISHFNGPLCVLHVGRYPYIVMRFRAVLGVLWAAVRPCSVGAVPLHSGGHPGPFPGFGQIPARFCGGFCVGSHTFPGGSLRGRLRVIVAAKVARFLCESR